MLAMQPQHLTLLSCCSIFEPVESNAVEAVDVGGKGDPQCLKQAGYPSVAFPASRIQLSPSDVVIPTTSSLLPSTRSIFLLSC